MTTDPSNSNSSRRSFLVCTAPLLSAVGSSISSSPFISSLLPDARAEANEVNVKINLKRILPGFQITVV